MPVANSDVRNTRTRSAWRKLPSLTYWDYVVATPDGPLVCKHHGNGTIHVWRSRMTDAEVQEFRKAKGQDTDAFRRMFPRLVRGL